MLEQVLLMGNALIQRKAELGRGAYGEWVKTMGISPRTARLYMQIAREVDRTLALHGEGHVATLPLPTTLRDFAAQVRTTRGRVRKSIGSSPAIPLPAGLYDPNE
jgi:hypothetical protein